MPQNSSTRFDGIYKPVKQLILKTWRDSRWRRPVLLAAVLLTVTSSSWTLYGSKFSLLNQSPQPVNAATCGAGDGSITFYDDIGGGQCIGVLTSGTTFGTPSDWSNTNKIELIGAGGNGGDGGSGGGSGKGGSGGGGGAYGVVTDTASLSASTTYDINIGAAHAGTSLSATEGTWFCSTNGAGGCANVTDTNVVVGAQSGAAGATGGPSGGAGGNTGTNKTQNGGAGASSSGSNSSESVGGGGAAGSSGAGQAGSGQNGGDGDSATTPPGGAGGAPQGGAGGNGAEWTVNSVTYGSGGGGAGRNAGGGAGGAGGNYGAGGGGGAGKNASSGPGGAGTAGIIIVIYTPAASTITVSGSCYTDETEGAACTDDGANEIKVAVNGVVDTGVDTVVDGAWSFTIDAPASGNILVFFINGEATEAEEATTVVKYDGTGDVDLVKMYESQLVIGTDSGSANTDQTLTVADLDTTTNGYENSDDEDVLYDVTAGADLTVDASGNKNEQLYIINGDTFRPASGGGSDVTTEFLEIDTSATWTADSNAITLTGTSGTLFTRTGTFTQGTSTVSVTSASGTPTLLSAATTFHKLTINAAATIINDGAAITLNNAAGADLTITSGVLNSTSSITGPGGTNGTFTIGATGVFCLGGTTGATNATCDSGATQTTAVTMPTFQTYTFNTTSAARYLSNAATTVSSTPTYGDLVFAPVITVARIYTMGGALTINGDFNVNPGAASSLALTVNTAGNVTVASGKTTTITGAGAGPATSSVDLRPSATDYDLSTGLLDIQANGTLDATGAVSTITLTGTTGTLLTVAGTLTEGSSTVVFNGDGSPTALNGNTAEASTFNNLSLTPSISTVGRTYAFGTTALTVNGNFLIQPTGTQLLTVNPASNITVATTGTTTISRSSTATSTLDLRPSATDYNLTTGLLDVAAGGTLDAAGSISVITLNGTSGTLFTRGGTFTQGTSDVQVTSASGTPTLLSGTATFHKLTINSTATVINSGSAITINNVAGADLTITDGVFNATSAITGPGGTNGTFSVAAGKTLCLGGTTGATNATCDSGATQTTAISMPTFQTYTFNSTSTVSYLSDAAQTVSETPAYGHLNFRPTLTAGRTYTFGGAPTINGNLDINPDAASALALTVDMAGDITIAASNTLTITRTGSNATSVLDTRPVTTDYNITAYDLTIAAGGTLDATGSVSAINISNSYSNSGTFTAGSSVTTFTATDTGNTLGGTMTGASSFYDLTFNGVSGEWTFNAAVATNRDFTVTNGNVLGNSNNLTVARDFTLANTAGVGYTPATSTVTVGNNFTDVGNKFIEGSASTLDMTGTSDNTGTLDTNGNLYNFTAGGSGKTITIGVNMHAVNGVMTVNGGTVTVAGGTYLNLQGTTSKTPFVFGAATSLTGSNTLAFRITGGTNVTFTMAGGDYGTWHVETFTSGTNDSIYNFAGGITTTNNFMVAANDGVTGTTVNTQNNSLTAGKLQFGDGSAGREAVVTVNLGSSTVTLSNTTESLLVHATTGGTSSVLNMGTSNITVSGNVLFVNGTDSITVDDGTSTLTWDHTSGTKTYAPNGQTLYNVILNGSGGTVTPNAAVVIANDLTMTAGTLNGIQNITVNGTVAGTAGIITLTGGTFEQRVAAAENFGTTSGSTAWTFNNLTFSNSHASTGFTITTQTGGTGGITVPGTMLIGKSGDAAGATTTLNAGNRTWTLSGTDGDPFQILASPAGVLTGATSTFNYTGDNGGGNTTIQSATYENLTVNNATETYVLESTTTAGGNLTITAGTLDVTGSNHPLTVGENYTNSGTFTARSGTVTFNATDTGNTMSGTLSGGSAFNNLIFNGSGGEWTPDAAVAVTNDITMTAGTLLGTQNVTVNGHVAGTAGAFNLTGGTFEQRPNDVSKNFGTTSGSTAWTFNNLIFSDSCTGPCPAGNIVFTTQTGGTGDINVSGILSLANGGDQESVDLNAGNRTWTLSGTGGNPFQINVSSDLVPSTSNFNYTGNNGAGNTTITAETYNNLTVNNGSETYVLEAATVAGNDLTITAGTLDVVSGSNWPLTIGNSYSNSGTFTSQNGTVTFNATDSGNTLGGTLSGTSSFYNLIFDGVSGVWTMNAAAEVDNDLTITNGELIAPSAANLTITNSYSNSGTFTHNSGTVIFNATDAGNTLGGTMTGTSQFNALTFNGASGSWTVNNGLRAIGAFNLTNGTLVQGANIDLTFLGDVALASGVTFTKASGTGKFIMDGDAETETFTDSTAGLQDLGHIQIGLSPGTTNLSSDMSGTDLTIMTGDRLNTRGWDVTMTDFFDCQGTCHYDTTDTGAGPYEGDGTITTIGGDYTMSATGTFTIDTDGATPTKNIFNGSADQTFTTGSKTFYQVELNNTGTDGSADNIIVSGALDVNGVFTITNGDLDVGTNNPTVNVAHDFTIAAAGTVDNGTGTWTFDPTGTKTWTDNNSTKQDLGTVVVGSGASTPKINLGTSVAATKLTINASHELSSNGANTITISGTGTAASRPFINSGTFTYSTGTITFIGNGATEIEAMSGSGGTNGYYNLNLNPAGATDLTMGTATSQTFQINNAFNVGNGTNAGATAATYDPTINVGDTVTIAANATFTSTVGNLTVSNDWTNNGTFTHSSGTVTFDTTATAVLAGATTFYNFTSTTAAKTIQFTAGQTFTIASGGVLTLTGGADPNEIQIQSTTASQWFINHQGTESVSNVQVINSGCDVSSTDITTSGSTDDGNNGSCWLFGSTYNQTDFRFGQPNGLDIDYTGAPAENAAYTTTGTGDDFRLRMTIHVGGSNLALNGETFKLQYGEKTGATCTSGVSWGDVGTASGVIRFYDGAARNDGDNLTGNAGDPVHGSDTVIDQDYEEANNFTNSVAAINSGDDGMWDFSLENNSAVGGKKYCFKIVLSTGTDIDTYTNYPEVTIDEELIFNIDATSKDWGVITPGDNPTNQTTTLTTTTNAASGYVVYAWATQEMTMGSYTIPDWTGTNAAPTTFPNGSFGFGYTTDDSSLTGGTADRFTNGGAKYAGFVNAGAGDPVADRTSGPVSNATDTITYRLAADVGQEAGKYQTVIVYVASLTF